MFLLSKKKKQSLQQQINNLNFELKGIWGNIKALSDDFNFCETINCLHDLIDNLNDRVVKLEQFASNIPTSIFLEDESYRAIHYSFDEIYERLTGLQDEIDTLREELSKCQTQKTDT